ncbi:hypothetical protein AB0I94_41735 [Streptomyces sp. NPDC050147]|uniref:hypothetical protein n=1 Tax=Streptomyces sp. NPDC050147 TaxID=3155513 RepID=UPI00343F94DE
MPRTAPLLQRALDHLAKEPNPQEKEHIMAKKVTITESDGDVIETTVSDDATAREYEDLPFQVGHIVTVTITDD